MNLEDHPCYGRARQHMWRPAFVYKGYLFANYQDVEGVLCWGVYSFDDFLGCIDHQGKICPLRGHIERDELPVVDALVQLHR